MGGKAATDKSPKMVTLNQLAIGKYQWNKRDEARIERNLFAFDGETFEALRFCKYKDGRHTRVHLVISREEFLDLFRSAVENGVFEDQDIRRISEICGAALEKRASNRDPLLAVVGIGADGRLAHDIDEELYGEEPS